VEVQTLSQLVQWAERCCTETKKGKTFVVTI